MFGYSLLKGTAIGLTSGIVIGLIMKEAKRTIKPKSYAENFSFKRKGQWSH